MQWLRQSTAITQRAGPFVDITDGLTLEEGLTLDQADTRLSKAGGDFAQKTETTSATHDENAWYIFLLDATDTDTLGMLTVNFIDAGARPVSLQFMVVPANVWDSMFGSDLLQTDMTQIVGSTQSAIDLKDFADAGYDPATNKVTGVVLVDTTTVNSDMVGTDSAALAADVLDKLGAVNEAAAAGDPSATESVMQYVKQIVNILTGGAGIITMPAAAAPGNGVSIAEMIRAIYDDTNEVQSDWTNAGRLDALLDAIKAVTDVLPDSGALDDLALILADTGTDGVPLRATQPSGWADNLAKSAGTMIQGLVDTTAFSTTITEFESDTITEATPNHYKDSVVQFLAGSVMAGQRVVITSYALVGGRGHFTVTAMTESPPNNAPFQLV